MTDTQMLRRKSMTKRAYQEWLKQNRTLVTMNTRTEAHKSKKDYNRQQARLATKRGEM